MHGLGLFYALMSALRTEPDRRPAAPSEPPEPLDEATFDAWRAWARGERRRWTDPVGPIVPASSDAPAVPIVRPPERGVLGRI